MNWNKTKKNILLSGAFLVMLGGFSACKKDNDDTANKPDVVFVALTNNGILQTYNANNSTSPISSATITGLQSGETLLAIDFRPATGELYGLGSTSRIYKIDRAGKALALGSGPFSPALAGTIAGFDFNPTVDRIRIVTSTGQNLRANPETGTIAATDGSISGAAISSVAYTNSKAGVTSTVLFDIDVVAKKLYKQDPPNDGKLVEVGSLGTPDATGASAFDIAPSGIALAAIANGGASTLYQVNLDNGTTTDLGAFSGTIIGLALPTEPVAYAVDDANNLIIFNPAKADERVKPITKLQAGETIYGIDFRPVNGQLYALGSTSRLYTINLANGEAAQVGTLPLTTLLSGTTFGFDFNPTVDRIRVVSNTGQNLRLDPNTGILAGTDGPLNPGSPAVSAAAYTNNFAGATTTTLFDIDHNTDKLFRQDPPNNGTLVEIGNLGINVEAANGFDISSNNGVAYALLTVGSSTKLYSINLNTGAATAGIDMSKSVKGFALGLGF